MKICKKALLIAAPQNVVNGVGVSLSKIPEIPQIPDAHTIAASRRLAPHKKMVFEE